MMRSQMSQEPAHPDAERYGRNWHEQRQPSYYQTSHMLAITRIEARVSRMHGRSQVRERGSTRRHSS